MTGSICFDIIEPLKELIYQYDFFLRGYKEKEGVKIAAVLCDTLPFEIIYYFGYIPLRIPSFMLTKDCCSTFDNKKCKFGNLYEMIIIPEGCSNKGFYKNQENKVFFYKNPSGYGDEFTDLMDKELHRLFNDSGDLEFEKLSEITEMYNIIRRQLRGISSKRKNNPDIISYDDLNLLFEASMILPPEIISEYLNKIIERISSSAVEEDCNRPRQLINSFLYASFMGNGELQDKIEQLGFNIFEDDSCGGRRQFDISVNSESQNLYKEILHAYSFKPYCSSRRKVEERYELLYKLLKSHDVELVIFIEDLCCKSRKDQIDFLNVKIMRSGVDTIKINKANAIDELTKYRDNSFKIL